MSFSPRTWWIISGVFLAIALGSTVWYVIQLRSSSTTPATQTTPGANPNVDSDGDGLNDEEETNTFHTDRLLRDTDADGLTDSEEVGVHRTNPLKPDTDADGYGDGEEVRTKHDPLTPAKS